ncbi:MAG: Glucosamine/galactosamine-6-phosphate isomerase [Actinoallomurus sp.]|nr:Glucosamine/galactosamine-6-phosphate isomerase [Actinoallomurus sp.]
MTSEDRRYGQLPVAIHPSPDALGAAAAEAFATAVGDALRSRPTVAVILATGNSQLPFFASLRSRSDVDWSRIDVFHMDEYLGMSPDHPASFRRYLHEQLVDIVGPRGFHGMRGDADDAQEEIGRYSALLDEFEPVVCVLGIGENAHLAFNDPPADFATDELVHLVELDEPCRHQQWTEGHFPTLDAVPHRALSLTVPALLRPSHVFALVPEKRKAEAVRSALEGPVTPQCPASILQETPHARLFLDPESSSLL